MALLTFFAVQNSSVVVKAAFSHPGVVAENVVSTLYARVFSFYHVRTAKQGPSTRRVPLRRYGMNVGRSPAKSLDRRLGAKAFDRQSCQ